MRGKQFYAEWARAIKRRPGQLFRAHKVLHCPLCDHRGWFVDIGDRLQARCPSCGARERDRTIAVYWKRAGWDLDRGKILHFSPEKSIWPMLKDRPGYVSSDVVQHKRATRVLDIQNLDLPDAEFDYLICNHVLEHVERDGDAMRECLRVLKPGGQALFSVPQDLERAETWNPPPGTPQAEIERICGRLHVRLYGRDFPDLLRQAGFEVEEITVTPEEDARHRLITHSADKVYAAKRPGG